MNEIEVRVSELKRLEKEAVRNSDSGTFAKLHAEQVMLESEKEMIFSVIDERNRETPDGDFMKDYAQIKALVIEDIEKYRKELLPFCKKLIEQNEKSKAEMTEVVEGIKAMAEAYKPESIYDTSTTAFPPFAYCKGVDGMYAGAVWIIKHIEEGYNRD